MVSAVAVNNTIGQFEDFVAIVDNLEHERSVDPASESSDCIDIIEFCESDGWGRIKLFPAQSMFFKIAYKLWDKYPFTDAENALMDLELVNWGIDLRARCHEDVINHYMMVVGRRGLKSSTIALIMSYEAYKLVKLGDPQKHYGLLPGIEIYITNCASNEDQAKTVYNIAYDRIKSIEFFKPYLDNTLDNSTEIALFSVADYTANQEILRQNALIPRGEAYKKGKLRNGTIRLKSIPTSATGARSRGAIVVIFDEFAHFERVKSKSRGDPRDLLGGNKRTDKAMYRALAPSSATFGTDYKLFVISSPADCSGECYKFYLAWKGSNRHYVQQFATWEVNPLITRQHPEVVESEQQDPTGFKMEWAGEFVASISKILEENVIAAMVNPSRVYTESSIMNCSYIITIDPAKASDVDSDTYAVGWGHAEQLPDGGYKYIVDGLKGFLPTITPDPETGEFIVIPLDPGVVDEFVLRLAQGLKRVVGLFYDQFNSTSSIAKFRKMHLPAIETTYTIPYKRAMYSNFVSLANVGKVEVYGVGNLGGEGNVELDTLVTELEYIQRVVAGNSITYKHPESGVITTDDFADVTANLVYQLDRFAQMGMEYLKNVAQTVKAPINMGTAYKPVLTGGVSGTRRGYSAAIRNVNVANRLRTHRR
jgi:hypothetical protein